MPLDASCAEQAFDELFNFLDSAAALNARQTDPVGRAVAKEVRTFLSENRAALKTRAVSAGLFFAPVYQGKADKSITETGSSGTGKSPVACQEA